MITGMKPVSRLGSSVRCITLSGLAWFGACLWLPENLARAQEIPKSGFAILNLVPKNLAARVWIGTNPVAVAEGADSWGLGTYTGLLPWKPEGGILKIEAKGYAPLEKKPFLKAGETPLFVLKEVSSGTLDLLVVPNTKSRAPSFYDALNLTDRPTLRIQANQKDFDLPQGQRVRLTTEKMLRYKFGPQAAEPLDPSENGNFLLVFFTDGKKEVQCCVTRDDPL